MGLDMFLQGQKFLWTNYDDKAKCPRKLVAALFPEVRARATEVEFEIAYWRKANAVHNWFVENVQNGEDDCETYEVTKDHLIRLRIACEEALNGDTVVLPTKSGFFFGSTAYGPHYKEDLKYTIESVAKGLNFLKNHGTLTYRASW